MKLTYPKKFKPFINEIKKTARENGVKVILSPKRFLDVETGSPCNGYFDNTDQPILAVACGQPWQKWLPVLLHESSHMDQWLEKDPVFNTDIGNGSSVEHDALNLILMWCDNLIELSEYQLDTYINKLIAVELDCEKRTAQKILDYEIPLDITDYIKRANAYIYFYAMMKFTRKWYQIDNEPYAAKEILNQMPSHFYNDYTNVSPTIKKLYLKLAKAGKK
jgi:hypothetical protein